MSERSKTFLLFGTIGITDVYLGVDGQTTDSNLVFSLDASTWSFKMLFDEFISLLSAFIIIIYKIANAL